MIKDGFHPDDEVYRGVPRPAGRRESRAAMSATPLARGPRHHQDASPASSRSASVDFDLRAGEVHALCGENGAGKSHADQAARRHPPARQLRGRAAASTASRRASTRIARRRAPPASRSSTRSSRWSPEMTVAENIFLGNEPRRFGLRRLERDLRARPRPARRLRASPSIRRRTVARPRRRAEAAGRDRARRSARSSRILILDEPTAALDASRRSTRCSSILRGFATRGIACIYISHKLDEVFAIADRITVLRDGAQHRHARRPPRRDEAERHPRTWSAARSTDLFPRRAGTPGEVLLQVERPRRRAPAKGARRCCSDISFEVARRRGARHRRPDGRGPHASC